MSAVVTLYKFALPCPQCGALDSQDPFPDEYYPLSKPFNTVKNPSCNLCGDSGIVVVRKMVPPLEMMESPTARVVVEWI